MTPDEQRQRDARNRVVWDITEELRTVNGLRITVRDREHAAALLDAWEHIPVDGSDYEWSTILAATTRYLLDYPTAQRENNP